MIADRARSLRGPSEVTDRVERPQTGAAQRGPARGIQTSALRCSSVNPRALRGISREAPIIATVLRTCAAVVLAALSGVAVSAVWPQFLGPERNGIYRGPALAETWPPKGPRVAWQKTVGQGFAAPVVAGNRLIVFHRVGAQEVVDALDPITGAAVWRYQYATTYRDDFGFDEGPRAVPVIADGIVYTFGAEGQLHAVNVATGQRVWSEDTMRRFNVPKAFFGAAGSPLVEGGRVIANVGGPKAGIVAFDAKSGQVQWTATTNQASYSSGVAATFLSDRRAIS